MDALDSIPLRRGKCETSSEVPGHRVAHGLQMQCFHCAAETPDEAVFCPECGGRLRPPDSCPSCGAAAPPGGRFCGECGQDLLATHAASQPAAPAPSAGSPAPDAGLVDEAHSDEDEDVQALLRREAANLPAVAPPPKSSVGSNMLVFVAVLALLVVGIYVSNKGKPKEATMFGGGAPATPSPASAAPAAPSSPSAPAEAAAPEAGGLPVSGTIRLERPDQVLPQAVLFITARSSAMGGKGPPLAVERVVSPSFPHTFELSAGDRMIKEMPWQGPLDISARLDTDGNAMTKSASDLTSGPGATNVELGTTDVELVLKPGE